MVYSSRQEWSSVTATAAQTAGVRNLLGQAHRTTIDWSSSHLSPQLIELGRNGKVMYTDWRLGCEVRDMVW